MSEVSELVFILDRSGSMCGLEKNTIKGFNEMIKKQKKEEGKAYVTTILFDDELEVLYKHVPINEVKKMTEKDYYVQGCTALLDAVGFSIMDMIKIQKKQKSDHVIFVITTDGYENASEEFTYSQVKKLIIQQQKKYGWEFIFLGARINAQKEASKIGIDIKHSIRYYEDEDGVDASFESIHNYVKGSRKGQYDASWTKAVNKDIQRRKKEQ